MFQTDVVGKIEAQLICNISFLLKIVRFGDSVGKCGTTRQATDENLIRHKKDAICMPEKEGTFTDTLREYLI